MEEGEPKYRANDCVPHRKLKKIDVGYLCDRCSEDPRSKTFDFFDTGEIRSSVRRQLPGTTLFWLAPPSSALFIASG